MREEQGQPQGSRLKLAVSAPGPREAHLHPQPKEGEKSVISLWERNREIEVESIRRSA